MSAKNSWSELMVEKTL